MSKCALLTGVTGQDGSYLADLLIEKRYEVHGIVRRGSTFNRERIKHLEDKITIHYGDLHDSGSLIRTLEKCCPDEVYHLGAMSHVKVSFETPEYNGDVTGLGAIRMLEAVRDFNTRIKYYQASSSEMFGSSPPPQNEQTPFHPRSPYGCSKVFAYWSTVNYREAYGIHASNGILFNHESPRRGENFVTRKITRGIADIVLRGAKELRLGNLEAKRDWGHAKDFVRAQWMMLQQDKPDDYVISTGESHSVREFLDVAFAFVGLHWEDYVKIDPKFFRPTEVDHLLGDCSKAKKILGWTPTYTFEHLVHEMVAFDLGRQYIL